MATILVVDDKEMMRDSLSLALSRAGHKAVTSADPLEALALVRQHRPACVITDLKMPKSRLKHHVTSTFAFFDSKKGRTPVHTGE